MAVLASTVPPYVRPYVGRVTPVAQQRWQKHARWLVATDAIAIVAATSAGLLTVSGTWTQIRDLSPTDVLLLGSVVAGWLSGLALTRSRDRRVVGVGPQEYTRILVASWWTFAALAVVVFTLDIEVGRGQVLVALPLGVLLLLIGRRLWRFRLYTLRRRGQALANVLVAGHRENVRDLVKTLQLRPQIGYQVVALCVTGGIEGERVRGVPVVGTLDDVADVASAINVDVVAVTGSDSTTADSVRRLAWALSPRQIELMIASSLADVAGPRILVSPVEGARLVHVDAPQFTGPKYVVKSALDWVAAAIGLVLLAPLFAAIAIAIKATSPGPVFFRQVRIGRDGKPFRVFKFRSMTVGSEARLDEVIEGEVGMFYKAKVDPRVTSVGRLLRRTSLDELPQLINVFRLEMSLVGPRPQVEREVAQYDGIISRRLFVKPGLTGPWQINGRSDLPLDESIRYDVLYVENWSLLGDLLIILKTFRAIVRGAGAY